MHANRSGFIFVKKLKLLYFPFNTNYLTSARHSGTLDATEGKRLKHLCAGVCKMMF